MKTVARRKAAVASGSQGEIERALAPVSRPKRVARHVYRHLRRAIVVGAIVPSTRLRQVDAAAALNVSRTPVREAISRLICYWLVRELATGGVEVVDIYDEVTATFYIREALEIEQFERLSKASGTGSFKERVRINQRFHFAIAQAPGWARLAEMISSFPGYYWIPAALRARSPDRSEKALRKHRKIGLIEVAGDTEG